MPTFRAYDGTVLAYHAEGEGEPLVCLPGGPMRASAYLGDLGGLTADRRLVRLDLRGTGDSAVPDDDATYRCDRLADDVEALREHCGLDRADVLAHSAGANLALLYAAACPGRVSSLVLVTPGARALGITATEEDWRGAVALRRGEPWYEAGRAAWEAFLGGAELDDLWPDIVPFMYGRWDAAARKHAADDAHQSDPHARAGYYAEGAFDPGATREALAALEAPVLVIAGEYDGAPTPARAGEIAAVFPHGTVAVRPGAGHYPWLDDPGAFRRTVAGFLETGGRPP
ncbi:alpha/beta fold hydrolase [Streptomyces tirandamycinicus]|uniref:Alpha/beta hydrolase n=1 Tax=Streptomyces tirandamycinicus TaxID=2174846 RepID=A0A2S1T1F8_9ACTN|nr:alpha/beta hydrolase [Streptomyces tirandamycinicus]AWI32499.1 alpha/beta hydrolase [Streptomyces tirandamycinicus]